MRRLLRALLSFTAVLLNGCGDSTAPTVVTSITLGTSMSTIDALGGTQQLTATANDAKGRRIAVSSLSWSSSNITVATVDNGLVTAHSNGMATITASIGTVTGTVAVTVAQSVSQLAMTVAEDTLYALGASTQATGAARDSRGNAMADAVVTFSSMSPSVAVVDGTGLITAVAEGSAIIRATAGAFHAERAVHVQQRAARLVFATQPGGAMAGMVIATQPVVDVVDAQGHRMTADNSTTVTVQFADGAAPATIIGGSTRTVQSGRATFTALAMGGSMGQYTLRASAPGLAPGESASFPLAPGNPVGIALFAGNNQIARASTELPIPLRIVVMDPYDNPVPSVEVSWHVVTGAGSLVFPASTTNANGLASNRFIISRFAGQNAVRASLASAPNADVQFAATGTPNATISGVVTTPAASASAVRADSRARAGTRAATSSRSVTLGRLPRKNANGRIATPTDVRGTAVGFATTGQSPATFNGELLVMYRRDRVQAPPAGSVAYRQRQPMQTLRETIADAVAPLVASKTVRADVHVSPALLTARVTVARGISELQAIARIRQDPRVLTVERNGVLRTDVVRPTAMERTVHAHASPSSVHFSLTSPGRMLYPGGGLFPDASRYPEQSWHYNTIALPRAWQVTTGSANVLVAVIDDGVRFDHPAMAGLLTNDGYDFVSNDPLAICDGGTTTWAGDGDGYDPDPTNPADRDYNEALNCVTGVSTSGGHGLHITGTIAAAAGNSFGLVGVNRDVRIRTVRAMGIHGSGRSYDIAQAVLYAAGFPADNGAGGTVQAPTAARLLSMSIGGNGASTVLHTAIQQATAAGALIIVSAGNSATNDVRFPASYPEVISVSSVGPTLERAWYSSYHETVDLAAPGGNTNTGQGGGPTHGVTSSTWNFVSSTPTFASWQGTSMATPHVTGVAALLLALDPSLGVGELRTRLLAYAVDLGVAGHDSFYGAGLLNARNALTRTHGPAFTTLVHLVDAASGAVVRTTTAALDGSYAFTLLPDGDYWLIAGHDENDDTMIGLPGRRFAAAGGVASPTRIVVHGAATHTASFPLTNASEAEPNNSTGTANTLIANGYVQGALHDMNDRDVYRLRISHTGSYTIIAQGVTGACGYALEADPIVGLYSSTGQVLAINDDASDAEPAVNSFCSLITINLAPGDYYLQVEPVMSGRYVVSMRRN